MNRFVLKHEWVCEIINNFKVVYIRFCKLKPFVGVSGHVAVEKRNLAAS